MLYRIPRSLPTTKAIDKAARTRAFVIKKREKEIYEIGIYWIPIPRPISPRKKLPQEKLTSNSKLHLEIASKPLPCYFIIAPLTAYRMKGLFLLLFLYTGSCSVHIAVSAMRCSCECMTSLVCSNVFQQAFEIELF